MSAPVQISQPALTAARWWHVKWMWLVVGIPAVTVVAAITTIVLAVATYDPPVRNTGDAPPAHIRQANP